MVIWASHPLSRNLNIWRTSAAAVSCMCVTAMAFACGGAEHRAPTGEPVVVAIAIPDSWASRDTVAIELSETVDVADLETSLIVGLLRSDGIVLPFAAYGDGNWTRLDRDSIPRSIVQYDDDWYHAVAEDSFQALTAGSIVRFLSGDAWYEPWGQITDFHPRAIPYYKPVDRVGMVLSEARRVQLMRRVETDLVPAQLIALIREEFERTERSAALREAPGYREGVLRLGHPVDSTARAKEPLLFPTFYHGKFGGDGAMLYYFLAKRAYPVVPNEKPGYSAYEPFTVFQGWVLSRGGSYALSQPRMTLTCCSGMDVGGLKPFAVLTLGKRHFVIAETWGWEYGEKTILEVKGSGIETVLDDRY